MAKSQQQQQKQQFFICSTSVLLCGLTILLFCGVASGNGNINAEKAFPLEQRIQREVPTTETEVKQATVVAAHSATGEPEDIADKSIRLSEANDLERNFNSPYKELNIFKRAPNGFVGMRGKKEHEDDYSLDWNLDPLFHHSSNGIEEDYNDVAYAENERFKKAPTTAFYGVRGKKMPNRTGNGYNRLNEMVQELEEERLRERMLQDFIGGLAVATAEQNEINKRAPTGFTGLRGKRPAWDWTTDELASYEKRAPMNAFVGVRGKKDVSNQQEMHQNPFKRSPTESFSGKRRLADFSNKFVAVRGKKDATSEDVDEERQAAQFLARQRLRYLVNFLPSFVDTGRYGKRAPNGFVGMRGKRAAKIPSADKPDAMTA